MLYGGEGGRERNRKAVFIKERETLLTTTERTEVNFPQHTVDLIVAIIIIFCIIHAGFHRVNNSASLKNEAVWGATEDSSFSILKK